MDIVKVDEKVIEKWQSVINSMAELIGVPAGLIMRVHGPDIEVLVASETQDNPYHPGDSELLLDSGLYCETVINTKDRLLVPNALVDEDWQDNPDIKLGMISYLGYPIILPTGEVFGTICVLDSKENHYSRPYEQLVLQFKELLESHLLLLHKNNTLREINQVLTERLAEIKTLRGILPICSHCKKIKDDTGYWQAVESYIKENSEAEFSHSLCLDCLKEHHPVMYQENKAVFDEIDRAYW